MTLVLRQSCAGKRDNIFVRQNQWESICTTLTYESTQMRLEKTNFDSCTSFLLASNNNTK